MSQALSDFYSIESGRFCFSTKRGSPNKWRSHCFCLIHSPYQCVKDVGRVELGAQTYSQTSRVNGKPAAVLGLYQLPGTNAIQAVEGVRKLMEELKQRFPVGL